MGIGRKIGSPKIPEAEAQLLPQNFVHHCRGMISTDSFEALMQHPQVWTGFRSTSGLSLDAISSTTVCSMPDDASWSGPVAWSAATGQHGIEEVLLT